MPRLIGQIVLLAAAVADRFPDAEVIGVDFSPIQPAWVPPNVRFVVDDVEEEWDLERDFDFVHVRQMMLVLKDPMKLLRQCFAYVPPMTAKRDLPAVLIKSPSLFCQQAPKTRRMD